MLLQEVRKKTLTTKQFSETDIINMLEFFIDNIFVMFGGRVFQQTVGIPMGTNCAPLHADLFLIRMGKLKSSLLS
jgi:hypothetical protein